MAEPTVNLCKIYYGNTNKFNFIATGNIRLCHCFFLVRLNIKAKTISHVYRDNIFKVCPGNDDFCNS